MLRAQLFIIVKYWKQSKCHTTLEWKTHYGYINKADHRYSNISVSKRQFFEQKRASNKRLQTLCLPKVLKKTKWNCLKMWWNPTPSPPHQEKGNSSPHQTSAGVKSGGLYRLGAGAPWAENPSLFPPSYTPARTHTRERARTGTTRKHTHRTLTSTVTVHVHP